MARNNPLIARLRLRTVHRIRKFAASLPGFDCDEALLHGVETRTSAPVQVARDGESCEATTLRG